MSVNEGLGDWPQMFADSDQTRPLRWAPMGTEPRLGYALNGDGYVAYQVWGEGEPLLWFSDWPLPLEWRWTNPQVAAGLERVGSFAEAVSFDRRGLGISDPMPIAAGASGEEWVNDTIAVLDDLGWHRVNVFSSLEGSMFALMMAAMHPDRVSRLVLFQSMARGGGTDPAATRSASGTQPDWNRLGGHREAMERWRDGTAGSIFSTTELHETIGRFHRTQISPAQMLELQRVWEEIDVRAVLGSISAPTLVINRRGAQLPPPPVGERLAAKIPGARFVTVDGDDSAWYSGDPEPVLAEVQEFFTGVRGAVHTDRFLATVLFTDIVASTERTALTGDAGWKDVLNRHDSITAQVVEQFQGRLVKTTGDGVLAVLDGPARAVRCARELVRALSMIGLDIRSGIHTGEIERRGDDVAGIGVVIARRICDLAGAGEVWASSVVPTLSVGSGLEFHELGTYELKGVPGDWPLFEHISA